MDDRLHFLAQHGYLLLFGWVFAEQLGIPLPAIPMLLAAGALSATGHMDLMSSVAVTLLGCLFADLTWYEAGRRRGARVLGLICKISLEPDSCVRQTQAAFGKQGLRALLVAKFIPGLNAVAAPMAGVIGTSRRRFLMFDFVGALLWSTSLITVGYVFSAQVAVVTEKLLNFAGSFVVAVVIIVALWVGWKFINRWWFIRKLRVARITPQELKAWMDDGREVFIVDLRHRSELELEPQSILGALRVLPDELEQKHEQIPRDRDVILYCT